MLCFQVSLALVLPGSSLLLLSCFLLRTWHYQRYRGTKQEGYETCRTNDREGYQTCSTPNASGTNHPARTIAGYLPERRARERVAREEATTAWRETKTPAFSALRVTMTPAFSPFRVTITAPLTACPAALLVCRNPCAPTLRGNTGVMLTLVPQASVCMPADILQARALRGSAGQRCRTGT